MPVSGSGEPGKGFERKIKKMPAYNKKLEL